MTTFLTNGPADAPLTLVLAHGAGAAMDSPFMATFAEGIAAAGIRVLRFEFPYMAARRETGARKAPDREAVLLDAWRQAFSDAGAGPIAIGGKSMGGRMASIVAGELGAVALLCLGYPFHAPGRPGSARIDHLRALSTPALILQGARDPFGNRDDVAAYDLPPSISFHWLEDGDHDFKPRAGSGRTQRQNWDEGIAAASSFLARGRPLATPAPGVAASRGRGQR
jgi:predicted alpha/beta-hydrolase family hydrolase